MRSAFYDDPAYREKQASRSKELWAEGRYQLLVRPPQTRLCKNPKCSNLFQVKPYSPNVYCSHKCSAIISNTGRTQSNETRKRISVSLSKRDSRKTSFRLRITLACQKPGCTNEFSIQPYLAKTRKFCSGYCAISTIGKRTTSPKAAKSKPGVRLDIDPNICFYSTWEANVARVFNLVGIRWEYAPRIFDLGPHTYRPDFYLPEDDMFVEVKNFMGEYSLKRDQLFRKKYPDIKLEILSKPEYKQIQADYAELLDFWEYRSS